MLYERCVGEGGMNPEYFARSLTMVEANCFLKGLERRQRAGWEQARMVAAYAVGPHLKSFSFDMMPRFSWEDNGAAQKSDEDKMKELEMLRAYAAARDAELLKKKYNA